MPIDKSAAASRLMKELKEGAPEPISPEILDDNEKFLLYGQAKTGKTHTALTAPEPILFHAIGAKNEAKTYYSKDFQDKHGKKDLILDVAREKYDRYGRCKEPVGYDQACAQLERNLELDDQGKLPTSTGGFASLIVDNATVLTEFQSHKVFYLLDSFGAGGEKTTYAKMMAHGIRTEIDGDWKGIMSLMKDYVSWLFSLDKVVIFIAHEYEQLVPNRATQSTNLVGVKPQFIGRQRKKIASDFDNVWRHWRNGQFFEARTTAQGSDPEIVAGTRVGGIVQSNYRNPDISETISKFKAHAEKQT